MTADLAAWLLADDGPIAEDERAARDAAKDVACHRWEQRNVRIVTTADRDREVADFVRVEALWHLIRWDPARVLAECAAKRVIIGMHQRWKDRDDVVCRTCGEPYEVGYEQGVRAWPCPTLLALAQPYAGRPGWRDEWATT